MSVFIGVKDSSSIYWLPVIGVFLLEDLSPFIKLILSSLNTQLLIDVILLSFQARSSGMQFLKSLQTGDMAGDSQRSKNFLTVGVKGLPIVLMDVLRLEF